VKSKIIQWMIFDGRNLHLTYAVFILTDFQQNLFIYNRQILHRQQKNLPVGGFFGKCMSFVCQGGFSLTKKQIEKQVFNLEFALFAHRVLGKIACGNRAKLIFNSQKCA
jgi:hypothetical protein